MTILVIPVDSKPYGIIDPADEEPKLKWLQEKVGGYIEIVNLSPNAQMIVDEEGLLKEKEYNPKIKMVKYHLEFVFIKRRKRNETHNFYCLVLPNRLFFKPPRRKQLQIPSWFFMPP